jgi:hypothetical protein
MIHIATQPDVRLLGQCSKGNEWSCPLSQGTLCDQRTVSVLCKHFQMVSYDELSTLIGKCPELAIVRRFGQLAAQVVLRMQAELLELEDDLRILGKFEMQHPELREHAKSWQKINEAIDAGGRSVRKEKVLEVEEKLGKYCKICACLFEMHMS